MWHKSVQQPSGILFSTEMALCFLSLKNKEILLWEREQGITESESNNQFMSEPPLSFNLRVIPMFTVDKASLHIKTHMTESKARVHFTADKDC